jgi:hypothetical protein
MGKKYRIIHYFLGLDASFAAIASKTSKDLQGVFSECKLLKVTALKKLIIKIFYILIIFKKLQILEIYMDSILQQVVYS